MSESVLVLVCAAALLPIIAGGALLWLFTRRLQVARARIDTLTGELELVRQSISGLTAGAVK